MEEVGRYLRRISSLCHLGIWIWNIAVPISGKLEEK
jgi:hypothetical protein